MKKTKQITNLIVTKLINLLNEKFDKKNDLEETVNTLMALTFNDRNTSDSIALIERFEAEAHKELKKRKTLAIIEKNAIDWHFKKPHQADLINVEDELKNSKVYYEIINN